MTTDKNAAGAGKPTNGIVSTAETPPPAAPTPRTDKVREEVKARWMNAHGSIEHWRDLAQGCFECARQLERELAAAQAELKGWRKDQKENMAVAFDLQAQLNKAEASRREAVREVQYLRRFGNKDCTAMADAAMEDDAATKELK